MKLNKWKTFKISILTFKLLIQKIVKKNRQAHAKMKNYQNKVKSQKDTILNSINDHILFYFNKN